MLVAQLLSLSLQGLAVRPPARRSRRLTALRMVAASKEDAESNARLLQALLDEGGEDGCLVDKVWSTICEEENSMVKDPAVASHLQLDLDDDGKPQQLRFLYVDELDCIGCTYCASIARNSFMMEPEAGQHGQSAPLGSAPARLLYLLGARLAALGGSALPGEETAPPSAQPPPRVLESVASKVADFHRL